MNFTTQEGLNPYGRLNLGVDHTLTKALMGKKHKFG